ncbi:fumarylacetoacetate hydrolase family protein [Mycobacterium sp.]|uniref:fumarylacetoacetate hydrolase family protein n=1 Tax=Mycobacterium sp. TaxID=1785 RepID=UPI003341533D|nr:hydrolase family protein [Mycobacterium sp.]
MKIVVFGSQRRVGLVDDESVVDVNNAVAAYLSSKMSESEARRRADYEAPADLTRFIAADGSALDIARRCADHVKDSGDSSLIQPLASVRLRAPWPGHRIFCAAANYGQHVADGQTNYGNPMTREDVERETRKRDPEGFTKTPIEVMGPDDGITYPARTTQLDYEGEIAVVIGVAGKDIPLDRAESHIWGITLGNDWSDRDGTQDPKHPASFNLMKNFDNCASLGPAILVDGSNPQDLNVTVTVNGELRQDYNTREMIYSFAEYIAYLSKDLTLVPGDVIMGGTGTGTAADASKRHGDGTPLNLDLFLNVGDVVEVTSPKIGCLRNHIVAKQ